MFGVISANFVFYFYLGSIIFIKWGLFSDIHGTPLRNSEKWKIAIEDTTWESVRKYEKMWEEKADLKGYKYGNPEDMQTMWENIYCT